MMPRMVIAGGMLLLVGGLSTTPANGADAFTTNCATCHGETGHADTAAGKALKAPALAGDAKVAAMSQADLVATIKANAKHKSMLTKVSDADLAAAAARAKELAAAK